MLPITQITATKYAFKFRVLRKAVLYFGDQLEEKIKFLLHAEVLSAEATQVIFYFLDK
jgi:hypothetical protein